MKDREIYEEIMEEIKQLREVEKSVTEILYEMEKLVVKLKERLPLEMYRIHEKETRVLIPCEWCLEYGEIRSQCNKCGGKGIHSKTKKTWEVAAKKVGIEKIGRYNGRKVYFTSKNEYMCESEKLYFETMEKAQAECNKRNREGVK